MTELNYAAAFPIYADNADFYGQPILVTDLYLLPTAKLRVTPRRPPRRLGGRVFEQGLIYIYK